MSLYSFLIVFFLYLYFFPPPITIFNIHFCSNPRLGGFTFCVCLFLHWFLLSSLLLLLSFHNPFFLLSLFFHLHICFSRQLCTSPFPYPLFLSFPVSSVSYFLSSPIIYFFPISIIFFTSMTPRIYYCLSISYVEPLILCFFLSLFLLFFLCVIYF